MPHCVFLAFCERVGNPPVNPASVLQKKKITTNMGESDLPFSCLTGFAAFALFTHPTSLPISLVYKSNTTSSRSTVELTAFVLFTNYKLSPLDPTTGMINKVVAKPRAVGGFCCELGAAVRAVQKNLVRFRCSLSSFPRWTFLLLCMNFYRMPLPFFFFHTTSFFLFERATGRFRVSLCWERRWNYIFKLGNVIIFVSLSCLDSGEFVGRAIGLICWQRQRCR